ncbi:MAG: lactonase family protein [Clostridiales bacterium]|jgi:6-phosphogluconolactonase|nr:lactonase family protein [Clostridiales bacterium]
MSEMKKYVAYVSSYTTEQKDTFGIRIYDVDVKDGRLIEKDQVDITNSSYLTISHDQKYLYSITDFGVESYRIIKGGDLEVINRASINGMRGSYLSTDYTDKWLFVSGYHDGKITVLKIRDDGGVGAITDEVYHKGLGSIAERNYRPHVQCVKMTRDNKFLCACDLGMDKTCIYSFDATHGKIRQVDTIHSEQESAPRHIKFSREGRFAYIVHELKNTIDVYSYNLVDDEPEFEKVQSISTLKDYHAINSAASALNFSEDFKYLVSSNAGDNSVIIYRIDHSTGKLEFVLCLPISGDYPKDVALFPDNKHLVSLNHESNTLTFFSVDMDDGLIVMNGREMKVDKPNCIIFHKLTGDQI